jgi:hypothetical protein
VLMGGVGRQAGAGLSGSLADNFASLYSWLMRNDITVRGKYTALGSKWDKEDGESDPQFP